MIAFSGEKTLQNFPLSTESPRSNRACSCWIKPTARCVSIATHKKKIPIANKALPTNSGLLQEKWFLLMILTSHSQPVVIVALHKISTVKGRVWSFFFQVDAQMLSKWAAGKPRLKPLPSISSALVWMCAWVQVRSYEWKQKRHDKNSDKEEEKKKTGEKKCLSTSAFRQEHRHSAFPRRDRPLHLTPPPTSARPRQQLAIWYVVPN